ncbi:TPA: hypothetical protein RPO53_003276 [Escherichia coli]|nr:hypothetical protein [Escherichia coli]
MSIKNDGHYFCGAGGNRPDGSDEALTNMEDQPEHERQRITKMLNESDTRRVAEETKFRIQYLQDEEQKRVLSELVNVLISKR